MSFVKATKVDSKLRMALIGPAGSGKTYTALSVAAGLADSGQPTGAGRIAVLDSEHGSASKYADMFDFDVIEPETFSPQVYIDAILEAERAGYGVIILDSLSHAWAGKGGALEMVDAASRRAKGNKFIAWSEITPLQQNMVDTILSANIHVIGTIRSKMEYTQDLDSDGRKVVRKLGMQPVQRDQLEYEFDLVGDMDNENTMTVTKSRIPALSGAVIRKPGKQLAEALLVWLSGVDSVRTPGRLRGNNLGRGPDSVHGPVSSSTPASMHELMQPAPYAPKSAGVRAPDLNRSPIPVIGDAAGLLRALQAAGGEWLDLHDVTAALKSLGTSGWPKRNDFIAWGELYGRLLASRGMSSAGESEPPGEAETYAAA